MRLLVLIGSALISFSSCIGADENDLRHKLQLESQKGLALAALSGDDLLVIPFDGPELHFQAEHRFSILTIGKSGRMVLWWFRKPDFFDMYGEFVVNAMNGDVLARVAPKMAGFRPIALSDTARRLAFWTGHGATGAAGSLYWSPFDLSDPRLIDIHTGEPDWSADGSTLVYEKEGKVYLFDVSSASSRLLVEGHDPTWSPSGKWISFVAPDGHASLVTPDGASQSWSISQHQPMSPMRWSPEGDFVCFAEKLPGLYALAGLGARLLVARLSDGKTTTIRDLGSDSIDTRAFYWITDYRRFCTTCGRKDVQIK